jgi:hypothetical protein
MEAFMNYAILIFTCLMSFNIWAQSDQSSCQVIAPNNPELEGGLNEETLCADATYTLTTQAAMPADSNLTLTVFSLSTYSVSLQYEFTGADGLLVQDFGTEYWMPGDHEFVIDQPLRNR